MTSASSKRRDWLPWILAAAAGAAAAAWLDEALWRVLASLAAAALLTVRRLPRRTVSRSSRIRLLLLLAVASAAQATAPALWQLATSPWVRVWNVYHYYLGSKYFPELGYHDLYAATLAADGEDGYWSEIRTVRDLSTYELTTRRQILDEYRPEDHFSDRRWQDFQRDVRALQTQRPAEDWDGIFRDRGYNPPPVWTAVGRALTWVPADRLWSLKLLCSLDLALFAATLWLVARTFGVRAMACVLLLLTLSPVNEGRMVGGFLQYDWLCAIAAGLCFLRRRQPLPAGAAIAYAVGTRVFPVFLLLSAAVPVARRWVRSGSVGRHEVRLAVSLAIFGLLALGAGVAGGGLDAWGDFAANIGHHNDAHRFGQQRLGLAHVFTRDVRSLDFHEEDEDERRELFARQNGLFAVSGGLLLLAWLGAAARRSVPDAFLLGLVPFFVMAVSSRYYWSVLALLPLLARPGPGGRRRVRRLAAAQAATFAVLGVVAMRGFERFSLYSVFDLLLAALLAGLLAVYLLHDLRVRRRQRPLRRWYRSRALAAVFFVVLLLLLCWLRMPIRDLPIRDVDESVSALIAADWLAGGVPYRDAIDQRGPITYLIYAAVFAVSGIHDMEAVHWALLLLILLSCAVVFRLGRELRPSAAGTRAAGAGIAYLAAFLLAVTTFTYRRSQMLAFHTEWPMMLFDLVAVLLVWRALRDSPGRGRDRGFVLAGVCFAIGFLSKQPGIFDAGAAAVFVLLWQHRRGMLFGRATVRIASLLAAGFFATLAATAGYFAVNGALGDFVLYYWTYNVEHYTAVVPVAERLAALDPFEHSRHYLTANPLLFAGALWSVAAAAIAWLSRRRTDGRLLIALWMVFGYFGASYSGRNFGHYFIQIIPPACLLTALAADDLRQQLSPRRFRLPDLAVAARGVLAALAIIAFAAPLVRFGDDIAWRNLWRQHRPDERRERLLDAIREHSSPEEPIFVWGYYPELYVLAPRPPASRYSNTNYLTGMLPWENHQPGVDTSEHVVEGAWDLLMAELEASKPALVVDTAVGDHRYYAKYPITDFPALTRFLVHGYSPRVTVEDRKGEPVATLWIRDG
jgi:hypothetical protein